jgi:anti-anti-sigma factor
MSGSSLFLTESEGGTLIVVPRKDVTGLAAYNVTTESESLVEQLEQSQYVGVVFDLQSAEYFGTYMLELMHAVWRHVRAGGGNMVLCNASDIGKEILRSSRLDTLWPICTTREEALQALAR